MSTVIMYGPDFFISLHVVIITAFPFIVYINMAYMFTLIAVQSVAVS